MLEILVIVYLVGLVGILSYDKFYTGQRNQSPAEELLWLYTYPVSFSLAILATIYLWYKKKKINSNQ